MPISDFGLTRPVTIIGAISSPTSSSPLASSISSTTTSPSFSPPLSFDLQTPAPFLLKLPPSPLPFPKPKAALKLDRLEGCDDEKLVAALDLDAVVRLLAVLRPLAPLATLEVVWLDWFVAVETVRMEAR